MSWSPLANLTAHGAGVEQCLHEGAVTELSEGYSVRCENCGAWAWALDDVPVLAPTYRVRLPDDGPPPDMDVRDLRIVPPLLGLVRPAPRPENDFALFRSLFAGPPPA